MAAVVSATPQFWLRPPRARDLAWGLPALTILPAGWGHSPGRTPSRLRGLLSPAERGQQAAGDETTKLTPAQWDEPVTCL